MIQRGDKIEVLVRKTETMSSLSLDMKSTSRTIKNEMLWRNWKFTLLIILVVIAVIYLILVIACGGFSLSGCF